MGHELRGVMTNPYVGILLCKPAATLVFTGELQHDLVAHTPPPLLPHVQLVHRVRPVLSLFPVKA